MLNAIVFYRIGNWFYKNKMIFISRFFELMIFIIYNSKIPMSAKIGNGSYFAYGCIGCVLHNRTVIGENTVIGTNVTIGGRSGHYKVPVNKDNVYISTGAKILGPITIGSNSIIGANAVVINDVDPKTVVGGVPSKLIKKLKN